MYILCVFSGYFFQEWLKTEHARQQNILINRQVLKKKKKRMKKERQVYFEDIGTEGDSRYSDDRQRYYDDYDRPIYEQYDDDYDSERYQPRNYERDDWDQQDENSNPSRSNNSYEVTTLLKFGP